MPSLFLFFFAFLAFVKAQAANPEFILDCTNCPLTCNNDCYAVYVVDVNAGSKTYTWDKPNQTTENARRKASGCTQSNGYSACGVQGVPPYNSTTGTECDEFPDAALSQGGTGAILRCVPLGDNRSEGALFGAFFNSASGCKGVAPCNFDFFFNTNTLANSPFCMTEMGPNDGAEFKLQGGAYVNARAAGSPGYEHVRPDPAKYLPLKKRREFLLDNGQTVLAATQDMNKQYDGHEVWSEERGVSKIVRELFGEEKSLPFR